LYILHIKQQAEEGYPVPERRFEPIIVSRRKGTIHDVKIRQGNIGEFRHEESMEILFVITPPEEQPGDDVMQNLLRAGYHVERLIGGNLYVVTSLAQNLEEEPSIYRAPFVGSRNCAPSPQSDARYHLQYFIPNCGILLQNLERPSDREFAQTSSHYHKNQHERWFVISGSGTLLSRLREHHHERWITTTMKQSDCYEVFPSTEHQLRTRTKFTTLLVMTGLPKGFDLSDHFYVEPPPADMVII
jgi:mannose-6-phosphate isomerase-like protein (cupin superfamily)